MEASEVKTPIEYFCETGIRIGPSEIASICDGTHFLDNDGNFCYSQEMPTWTYEGHHSLSEREKAQKEYEDNWKANKQAMEDENRQNPESQQYYQIIASAIKAVNAKTIQEKGILTEKNTFWINDWLWIDQYKDYYKELIPDEVLDFRQSGMYYVFYAGDDKIIVANRHELNLLDALGIAKGAWTIKNVPGPKGFERELLFCNRVKKLKMFLEERWQKSL